MVLAPDHPAVPPLRRTLHGLPQVRSVEPGPALGPALPRDPRRTRRARRAGPVAVRDRLGQSAGGRRGPLTGHARGAHPRQAAHRGGHPRLRPQLQGRHRRRAHHDRRLRWLHPRRHGSHQRHGPGPGRRTPRGRLDRPHDARTGGHGPAGPQGVVAAARPPAHPAGDFPHCTTMQESAEHNAKEALALPVSYHGIRHTGIALLPRRATTPTGGCLPRAPSIARQCRLFSWTPCASARRLRRCLDWLWLVVLAWT